MQKLIKAIDVYIEKADSNLAEALDAEGFINSTELVGSIVSLEDLIARALTGETRYIRRRLNDSVDLAAFAADLPEIQALDNVDEVLTQLFYDNFITSIPGIAEAYIKQIDPALTVMTTTRRTTAWAVDWSEELGSIMKLSSYRQIENLLIDHLRDGSSVVDFARVLQSGRIRNEYHRARATALTEMLRAHSVAQQEALMQNPAVIDKSWEHTGGYRNAPRDNHVAIDGQVVRKDQPFSLMGADGNVYFPMYPRDPVLPVSESINCHCIHQGVVDRNILGLSLEERQELQRRAILEDDGEWERELRLQRRAAASVFDEEEIFM